MQKCDVFLIHKANGNVVKCLEDIEPKRAMFLLEQWSDNETVLIVLASGESLPLPLTRLCHA